MKKAFMLFAAVAMLATASFAQKSANAGKTEAMPRNLVSASHNHFNARMALGQRNAAKIAGNPVWNDTMSYCLNAPFYTGVGMTNGGTFSWGIKIEAAALTGRNNLTDVQLFINAAGNYQLDIYNAGDDMPTGTAVATQNVTVVAADTMTWKNIHLTNAVAINANQPMWVVFTTTAAETFPASAVQGNQYDNGKILGIDGEWMNVADAGVDATWMIRAISDTYVELPPQIAIEGPAAVRTGDTVVFTAVSPNANSYAWTIGSADYMDDNASVAEAMWNTPGLYTVTVVATNNAGSSTATLDVDVYSCDDITIPYQPNFSETLGCWDTICDSTHGTGWFTCAEMGLDEGQVLSMSAQSFLDMFMIDFPVDNWLISPEITMPTSGEYEVVWRVKPYISTYAGDHYAVYAISGTDTVQLFEETLNSNMTEYVDRMAVLHSTVSGDFKIAFRHFDCEGGYVIILDNIQVRDLTAPQLTLNGPAEVENGVATTFTAVCGNAESFEWVVNGNIEDETGATLTYTFTTDGLYTIVVTATNSVGSATDSMTVEVYTCEAINEFPYSNGFEGTLRCWNMVSADPANDDRFGIGDEANNGSHGFTFSSYSSADDYNQYLISPELELPEQQPMMFKFVYKGETTAESFRVLASSTIDDIASFTTVLGDVVTTATEWTEIAFLLPATTKYVAINYYGDYAFYLYIDDISIENLTAPIVSLTGNTRVMVDDEATFTAFAPLATSFTWTVDGTAVSGNANTLTYVFTAGGNHTVEVTATNQIGSNNASMTVEVVACDHITSFPYVQNFETANVFECWKFVDADGDGYTWNTDYLRTSETPAGHNGSTGLVGSASWDSDDGALTPDNWMILPAIDLPAGSNLYLSWYAKGQDPNYAEEHYSVYISTTGSSVSSFTNAVFTETTTGEWAGHNVSLAQYAGQTIHVAFRHYDVTDMFYLDIDDISISETQVGINGVSDINVAIYPNPVSNVLFVEGEGIQQVEVMDLNGRTILTSAATSLNLENLASGMYMVRVIAADGIRVEKIVKK